MFHSLGYSILFQFNELGQITILGLKYFKYVFFTFKFFQRFIEQVYELGIKSLSATVITSIFIGLVFSLQIVREFSRFGANYMIGGIVGLAIWRELGPLLTGVVVSARIGSAISSELGSMKVTEQIDALRAMSQNPIKYLVVPRITAILFIMPLLVGLADFLGFVSGFFVATAIANINPNAYFNSAIIMLEPFDIVGGLIKAVVFGFLIGLISCFHGLNTKSGSKGVGKSTTKAVVQTIVCIFVVNYFLSYILYQN
jgi:phospholipid/cholesterol/gamma-HCH transport system permease protein